MPEKRKQRNDDPAARALEAANQALAAANAAVQAAVKALAMSTSQHEEQEESFRGRRGASIRNAASKPATPRPAARPEAASKRAPAPSRRAAVKTEAGPKQPTPPKPMAAPRTVPPSVEEGQAVARPAGSAPIRLGPSTVQPAAPAQLPAATSAPAPVNTPVGAPPVPPPPAEVRPSPPAPAEPAPTAPAAPHADAAEAARQAAELHEREMELAAREAAMARYQPLKPARTVPAKPQAELNGYTVLVVDDEEQVRALTVRILTRYGYRVLEASGVEIALGLLDEPTANVDLVLSDVAMPGLSGKDLFRAISQSRPGLPVVFMSGYALGVYAPEGLIEEGVKMLPKPFTQEDLLGFVTEALEGAAAR